MAKRLLEVALSVSLVAGVVISPAAAAPVVQAGGAHSAWSTYLRAGPGGAYAVIDEVEHDTPLTVLGCAGAWCRVRIVGLSGYVDRDALRLPRPPTAAVRRGAACTVSRLVDYHRAAPTRFCPRGPTG